MAHALNTSTSSLPRLVVVGKLTNSRYPSGIRPENWDERIAGSDEVETSLGERLVLFSDGQQSPPSVGAKVVLTGKTPDGSFLWTLYGFPTVLTKHPSVSPTR